MNIKVKKLTLDAIIPSYAHVGDAGMDLYVSKTVTLLPGERAAISTGISLALPKGTVGLIWDKSGLSIKNGLKTLGGVVDASYRGEVLVGMINLGKEPYTFEKGHKVAQMLVQKVDRVTIKEVNELDKTLRGKSGFGSTGK